MFICLSANDIDKLKSGQPVKFDDVSLQELKNQIQRTLEDAGYSTAKFAVSHVPHGVLADLTIQVATLGPPSVLAAIEISGNRRDSNEDIIKYLGVQIGERLTGWRRGCDGERAETGEVPELQ